MYCQYTYNMVGVIKVKTEVLRMLKETDDYLSGQEICERLNVSRTAVWKVIKQLEAEGYEIEAVRYAGSRGLSVDGKGTPRKKLGGAAWRRHLDEPASAPGASSDLRVDADAGGGSGSCRRDSGGL